MNWMKYVLNHERIQSRGEYKMKKMTIIITMAGLGTRFRSI